MRIDVNEIKKIKKRLAEINKLDICDIIWAEGDEVIEINKEDVEHFGFTGLNNCDFVDFIKGHKK